MFRSAISWDVMGGVARRAWARNEHSILVSMEHNEENRDTDHITIPYLADDDLVAKVAREAFTQRT